MNKKDNVAMVPKYRFPEFAESWDIIPILNIGDVYKGGIFSKSDIDQNASIPCIHYGELFTKYNEVISIIYSKTNKKEGFKSKIGDILMPSSDVTPDGLAKASAIMLEDVILGGDMNIIRPNKKFNSIFISYLLNKSKKEIIKLVSGTTIKHIYPCQIITCQLPIANNSKEQQKIADCLFSIDKLISAEEKKLSLLNDYKKGWMQKLFPANGKNVPEWRFPEFSESWEVISISDMGCVYKGGVFSKADIDQNASTPCIHYGELFTKYNEVISIIYSKTNKKEGFKSKVGDILMPSSDVTPNGLAKASAIMVDDVILGGDMNIIRPNKKFDSIFLSYLLNKSKGEIIKLVSGTTIKHIYPCQIITCKLTIVNNKQEQQKIADFLFGIDKLIIRQTDKIEALKQHKKALMQGLFPAVEEAWK